MAPNVLFRYHFSTMGGPREECSFSPGWRGRRDVGLTKRPQAVGCNRPSPMTPEQAMTYLSSLLGLATGSVVWVVLSLAGLSALLASHALVATAARAFGAAYLVWYGSRLLRAALAEAPRRAAAARALGPGVSRAAAYRTGLVTGLTNPKSAVFW